MAQRWMVLLVLLGLVLENSLVLTRSRQARQASEEEEEELAEGNTRNPALILVLAWHNCFLQQKISYLHFAGLGIRSLALRSFALVDL